MSTKKLELLSPAANSDTAIQAIMHGADAIYMGGPSHGARKSASNSIQDIEKVVDFAHSFRAKVYITVNTIIYPEEIKMVESMIRDLYLVGVDALIIQDMGILRMKIPPIALHASTQCDIRTPEKALFLQQVGFSQLVLARELSTREIKEITNAVNIPVETFVHGALCVCYSGRCHASLALTGRSANRGECAQICRLPYTLTDSSGKIIAKDKYLLSLKDFNASHNLKNLIEAGVSSFKIEGRLKDIDYVKNITAFYNIKLNELIACDKVNLSRSSYGEVKTKFKPKVDKSFNRGFTTYFLNNSNPLNIASIYTPKSLGEKIKDVRELNNGDGISFFDRTGKFTGVNINRIEKGEIIPARSIDIPDKNNIYRTSDIGWNKLLSSETASRKLKIEISLDNTGVSGIDEMGVKARLPLLQEFQEAKKPMELKNIFEKLGNTKYTLDKFFCRVDPSRFYRISELTELRRNLVKLMGIANKASYPFRYRETENLEARYPDEYLDYKDNVSNPLAEEFYKEHGVKRIELAAEISHRLKSGEIVMTTRHCILRELGMCRKEKGNHANCRFPLYLNYNGGKFRLNFDCKNCEMKVLLD